MNSEVVVCQIGVDRLQISENVTQIKVRKEDTKKKISECR